MDLYSKRKYAAENPPKSYRLDLPQKFRNQVWFILRDALGYVQQIPHRTISNRYSSELASAEAICQIYANINKTVCEEHGILALPGSSPCDALRQWFLDQAETDTALDIVEVSFRTIEMLDSDNSLTSAIPLSVNAEDAISRLNGRFREHAIGYRYEQGQIIRVDSEFLNTEVTEPALQLLFEQGYEGALAEFRLAHEHYRQGNAHHGDCLNNCLKAVESVLKTICHRHKWTFADSDTASKLITTVMNNGLVPKYLQSHYEGLLSSLKSGVPTIRNNEGGHGSGEQPNEVPDYLAAYQLHLTASAIVLLVRASEAFDQLQKASKGPKNA